MAYSVMLAMPHNGQLVYGAAQGLFRASERHDVRIQNVASSNLAGGFNTIWCAALNGYLDGEITHVAFLHADIAPDDCWVDKLIEVMDERGVSLVSSISPIKDSRGLTSSGIGYPGVSWSPLRRFTMREVSQFPESFNVDDIGFPGMVLLHNTGCWVADLRDPLFQSRNEKDEATAYFTLRDRVVLHEGRWLSQAESEDWFFSRRLHELGVKTCMTRRVGLTHVGWNGYRNDFAWGEWSEDEQTAPLWKTVYPDGHVHKNGYWLTDFVDGVMFDRMLTDTVSEVVSGKVVDLGCGRGRYVAHLRELGVEAVGIDGNPATEKIPDCVVGDLADPELEIDADWTLCLEVGEHMPADLEQKLLAAIARCRVGAIVSWAQPGQPGVGHVNCHTPPEVVKLLEDHGLVWSPGETDRLRQAATLPYFKNNLLVFRKQGVGNDERPTGKNTVGP